MEEEVTRTMPSFVNHWTGYAALAVFVAAYLLVIVEEVIHLRKSKPVIVAAGTIWILAAFAYSTQGQSHAAANILRHNLLEYAELMLFLLSAMTFINTMSERNIFEALRTRLIALGLSLRGVFWLTGILAFLISPVADNLTTALVMGAVVTSMAGTAMPTGPACVGASGSCAGATIDLRPNMLIAAAADRARSGWPYRCRHQRAGP